jgi:hypothetical protein
MNLSPLKIEISQDDLDYAYAFNELYDYFIHYGISGLKNFVNYSLTDHKYNLHQSYYTRLGIKDAVDHFNNIHHANKTQK